MSILSHSLQNQTLSAILLTGLLHSAHFMPIPPKKAEADNIYKGNGRKRKKEKNK